jgi:FMN phosphatase YigB (HAD superfamily)
MSKTKVKPEPRRIELNGIFASPLVSSTVSTKGYEEALERDAAQIHQLLRSALQRKAVLSLDVFDTILLRNNIPEAERYLALSQVIAADLPKAFPSLKHIDAHDLLLARNEGMSFTYRTRPRYMGCGEGDIREVLSYVARAINPRGADDAQVQEWLLNHEVEFEVGALRLNRILAEVAEEFAQHGKLILVSDMYLPAAVIRRIFERLAPDFLRSVSAIFSSADEIVSKRSGKIFGLIEDRMGLPADAFLHVGDSLHGDVQQALRSGWSALHHPVPQSCMQERSRRLADCISTLTAMGIPSDWAKI